MNWFIIAFFATAIYSGGNFIDKYVVSKEVKDCRGLPIYGAITALCLGMFLWILTGFPHLPLKDALLILFAGALSTWATFMYFQALSQDEMSTIILLFQMIPLLVLVLSLLFLKETILFKQSLGGILILFSSIGISMDVKASRKIFRLSRSFFLMFIVDAMLAVAAICVSLAVHVNSFFTILSYESWGSGIGGILMYILFPVIRNSFYESFRTVRRTILALLFLNEGIFVLVKSLTYYAYSIGPTAASGFTDATRTHCTRTRTACRGPNPLPVGTLSLPGVG